MSTINYTYNVIVDRFRQFAAGHFQLRRFTHGEISQADLEKEAEWPWLHVKPRAINYSPGTRSFSFEIFISDLPRDKEDKTGYQAESITDCSLIFQDLINEIYLGNMFGSDVVLTRPVNAEPFVEQYTHTLTGVTGTIELNLDYDWSACSIPASWNYNTPTDSPSDGWGALQFIESLDQNGVFVSLDGDVEAPGNSYYYGTNASGIKGWYQLIDNVGITCEDLPECATIISIVDDISSLQSDMLLKANTADLGATAFSNDYNDLDNKPTIPDVSGFVPYTGATADVDLGTYNLTADHLALNVSPSGAGFVVGATQWNNTIGSSETLLKGGSVSLKNGVDLVARVVNKVTPNTTLTKAAYQAVRVSGAQGQRLAVELAQANNDNNSADTIGIVCETIATNQEGFIQTVGQLESINTTGSLQGETWADGDVLYLSPTTAGALTNIKPTGATGHIVVIGYVEYAHANNGKIYVKIMNGWELDELHNVYIDTPLNNNVLTYESSTSLWKNKTVETALGFTPVPTTRTLTINGTTQDLSADRTFTIATGLTVGTTPITSGTVGRVLFEGTGNVLQQSGSLFWNNTSTILSIGTSSPTMTSGFVGMSVKAPTNFGCELRLDTTDSDRLTSLTFATANVNKWRIYLDTANGSLKFQDLAIPVTTPLTIFNEGNIAIGTTTDAGFKLDVNGTARVSGTTTITPAANTSSITSSTYLVTGSGTTPLLNLNGTVNTSGNVIPYTFDVTNTASGGGSFLVQFKRNGNYILAIGLNDGLIYANNYISASGAWNVSARQNAINGVRFGSIDNSTHTSGNRNHFNLAETFAPTSGTGTYNSIQSNPTINQTGGANGITRGLYINPTLTAVADFRAIEVASGITILGAATTAKASLRIPSGTAPTSPVNGDIWFDGTDIKMRIGGVTKTFTLI